MNFYSFGYPIICQKERGSDTLFKIAHFLNNGATSLGLKPAILAKTEHTHPLRTA